MKWPSYRTADDRLRAYNEVKSVFLKMSHPKDNQLIPKGTVCIWTRPSHRIVKDKVVKVKVVDYGFASPNGTGFLNYYVQVLGDTGTFAAYHDDLKIETE
jgi:hypothetical protein